MKKKEYMLSKDAIKYLDNIKIEKKTLTIKSIAINTNFIFQIEKVEKYYDFIYKATLIDNDFRAGNFILFLNKKDRIPKKGDIISIGQIIKSYYENYHKIIFECRKIKFLSESENTNPVVDLSKIKNFVQKNIIIDNYDNYNIYNNNKKEINTNNIQKNIINENETNYNNIDFFNNNENDNDSEDKKEKYNNNNNYNNIINIDEEKKEYNNNNNYNHNEKDNNNIIKENMFNNYNKCESHKKYLLISDISENNNNINIKIKCIYKDNIREFKSQKNKTYQNYIFEDIKNDKIEAVSFDTVSKKIDKILNVNDIYQIKNCKLIKSNEKYCKINFPYKLFLTEFSEIINITNNNIIKNEFLNLNYEDRKDNTDISNITPISNIKNINTFEIINVFGFVLKDYGNKTFHDKYNNNYYGRIIILGDDSNYKITISIWYPNDLKQEYKEGELLYIQNCKVKEYKNKKLLYSTSNRKMKESINYEYDTKLKKYYSENKNIDDYLEVEINNKKNKISNINRNNNINNNYNNKYNNYNNQEFQDLIFIKEIISINKNKECNKDKDIRFRIYAFVKKINHSEKNYYYGCNNCRKKMTDDICHYCGGNNKVIIIHFSINVVDCSSSFWLLLFGDIAEKFLGIKGEEYKNILDKGISNENKQLNYLDNKIKDKQYIFLAKSKQKAYNNAEGIRFYVKYFKKKNKNDYFNLVNYLKSFLK